MRPHPSPAECAPVLRNVVLQDLPHSLARPNESSVRVGQRHEGEAASSGPSGHSLQEQAFAEGYRQGVAVGARQMAEARVALQGAADEARQAGFEQGRLEGLRRAKEEVAAEIGQLRSRLESEAQAAVERQLEQLQALMSSIAPHMQQLLSNAEDELLALSHEALCRMLGRQAAAPEVLHGIVRGLLAEARMHGEIRAHVHPDDFAAVSGHALAAEGWTWVADSQVQMGGVHLRSAEGSLDARLEMQLETLRQRLLQVRSERRSALAHACAEAPVHTREGSR